MKAAVLHRYGAPEFGDFVVPELDACPDGVLVEVHSATINVIDRAVAAGKHYLSPKTFPVVTGIEGAGVTTDNRRVYFGRPISPFGAMAECTLVPAGFALPIPGGVDFPMAATLGNSGMAALMPLTDAAQLRPGDSVVLLGGSGVVGRLAIQAARMLGARSVTVVGRNKAALAATVPLGASATVSTEGLEGERLTATIREASGGVDVIVDYAWGESAVAALAAGSPGVRLVQVGESAGATAALPAQLLRSVGASVTGFMPVHHGPEAMMRAYRQLVVWADRGDLTVDYELVPLADVAAAWERSAAARHKLVLVPTDYRASTGAERRRAIPYFRRSTSRQPIRWR
ncbi:zinc-binding dehydrogenase [Nocardia sp. CNY236]|uniref:quinone oxidoreductase family protein n=1 Tax=Nocardia sp. CNY236 TaxID=1169152 RepID=UPI0004114D90|nr:zinc-binding dehydrogenase [Nocardia sp. CNY236]